MAIASAATTNVRRIQRYLISKMKQAEETKSPHNEAVSAALVSFFVFSLRGLGFRLVFSSSFGS
jgi:hypothetical protein